MRFLFNYLIGIFIILPISLNAINASKEIVKYEQPDNTTLEVYLFGDEFLHWIETTDGYTLIPGEDNALCYAIINDRNELIASTTIAHNVSARNNEEQTFISTLDKRLKYNKAQLENARISRARRSQAKGGDFPTTGTNNLLLILVNFSDTSPTYSQTNFNNYMNQNNYLGIGSFKDFYYENSWGQLTMNTTVTAWVTVSNTHNYYGQNDASGYDMYPRELVYEAINLVDCTVDFSQFDNNGDGEVDGVAVIHQGKGEEASANAYDIWSHSWSLYGLYTTLQLTKDGVLVYDYTLQPETLKLGTYDGISTIGVMCHEFGHNMGAPDYYDTDYTTNGQYDGTGEWDLMAGGSWNYFGSNGYGTSPAHHNIYTKVFYNWVPAMEINSPGAFTLYNTVDTARAFFFNTTTTNEYFMIENRQQSVSNFEAGLPGSGMIIYHVDGNFINTYWSSNTINNTSHQGLYPKDAGGIGINTAGCPFPGITNNTSFTDCTSPNSLSWLSGLTQKPITDILQTGTIVSFNFMLPPPSAVTADTTCAFPGVMVSWAPPSGAQALSSKWINYDGGTNSSSYTLGGGTFKYGICFTPSQIANYSQVSEISFISGSGSPVYTIDIIQDSADGVPVYSSPLPYTANYAWNTLTLPSPQDFDNSRMLYFIITVQYITGEYPFVIDQTTTVDGFGNLFQVPGLPWTTWLAQFGVSGNWRIRAKIQGYAPAKHVFNKSFPQPLPNNDLQAIANSGEYTLQKISFTAPAHPADNGTKSIIGYQVLQNGVPLTAYPTNIFAHLDYPTTPNEYIYSVKTLYSEGNSSEALADTLNYPASLQLSSNPSNGGTTSGSGLWPYNSVATATAIPATGYDFVEWQYNGSPISTSNPYHFPILSDLVLTAEYTLSSYTVALTASPLPGGTVSGAGTYLYNETASCTANPNTGYDFVNWTENSSTVSCSNPYVFTVTGDRTLTGNFQLKSYTIAATASPTAGGTTGGSGTYNHGTSVNLSASANSGYTFVNWTESSAVISTSSSISFTATANRTLVANFSVNCQTTLTLQNITITGSVPDYEATQTITAAGGGTYFTVTSPNGDVTLAAGTSISLLPGFHAQSGSTFRAYIGGSCVTKESSLISHHETPCLSNCGNYLLYPNPSADGIFTLQNQQQNITIWHATVYDFSGKQIHAIESDGDVSTTINLSTYPNGIYLIRITNAEKSEIIKIIKR